MVKNLLTDLKQDGKMTMQSYFRTLKEFYETALCYLQAWNKHNENLSKLNCCLLDKVPTWENSDNALDLLSSECEILTINSDKISLNTLIYAIIYHEKKVNSSIPIPVPRKSSEVSVHLKENDVPHGNMNKVVELLSCLPDSNASIERLFSHIY
jgi:hypothetical protein